MTEVGRGWESFLEIDNRNGIYGVYYKKVVAGKCKPHAFWSASRYFKLC